MIYENALPKKNSVCSICNGLLKPAPNGKSQLHLKRRGLAGRLGYIERVDFCPLCAEKKRGGGSVPSVATWIWQKGRKQEVKETPALQKDRLKCLIDELFSQEKYDRDDEERYIVALLLHRAGIIKRRKGKAGSLLFFLSPSSSGSTSESHLQSIRFSSIPEQLSHAIVEKVSCRLKECINPTESVDG